MSRVVVSMVIKGVYPLSGKPASPKGPECNN